MLNHNYLGKGKSSSFPAHTSSSSPREVGNEKIPKWKIDSMKFRQAMKAARMVSKAEQISKDTGILSSKILTVVF